MNERLIELLREIRPNYGDVGSRDVDVRKSQEQIDEAIALLPNGGKGEADAYNRKLRIQLEQEWADVRKLKEAYTAPQAECAPRAAQSDDNDIACDSCGLTMGQSRSLNWPTLTHGAQAECGKSSGEAVGEITHSSFEGWYFHPYINWPEIGDGTKLYAAPQHSADIDAMRLSDEQALAVYETIVPLIYDPLLGRADTVRAIIAAIDAALQAKGVAE